MAKKAAKKAAKKTAKKSSKKPAKKTADPPSADPPAAAKPKRKKVEKRTLRVLDRRGNRIQKWVAEIVGGSAGEPELESTYDIDDSGCSCRGYTIRSDCTHMQIWRDEVVREPAPTAEAVRAAQVARRLLMHEGRNTAVIEAYVPSSKEDCVDEVRVRTTHPSWHSRSEVWDVSVPGGPLVRLRIAGDPL